MTDLFIFAGEASGDLLGYELLTALPQHLNIAGVGGPKMRSANFHAILPMEDFRVMGFVDVFFALPRLLKKLVLLRQKILEMNPQVVLLIDYAEFNLRLAESLRKHGYTGKICHFVCPSVWAWGKGRIPRMAKNLDLLLTLFPFEPQFFAHTKLTTRYVGHPLAERIAKTSYDPNFQVPGKCVAIFPGSRKKEILRNLPKQLKVAQKLAQENPDLFFGISVADQAFVPLVKQSGLNAELIPPEKTYDLMKAAHLAIAKSGTVTLELALHHVPTVVTYAISPLDLFIARSLLKIDLPHYTLVNIIQEEEVFPELFGPHFTEENLFDKVTHFLEDDQARKKCQEKCQELARTLGETCAKEEAARAILTLIK